MSVTYKDNHVEEGLDLLIEKFKNRTGWVSWLTPFLNQIQDLEDMFYDVEYYRNPDYATGAQLDGCGSIVGEPRYGRSDDDYRLAIRVRIAINRSRGTPEDIYGVLDMITEGMSLYIEGSYPAGYLIQVLDPIDPTDDPAIWQGYVEEATGAGIRAMLGVSVDPVFTWDSGYSDGDGRWGTGEWGTDGWGGVIRDAEDETVWDMGLWGAIFG